MFKRLIGTSLSVVLRHPLDRDVQVCPPLVRRTAPRSRHNSWVGWLTSTSPLSQLGSAANGAGTISRDDDPLSKARRDFIDTLVDIRTQQAGDVLRRIRAARSLRELWFLRTEVFNLVAHHRDQSEAAQRMAMLGSHFPHQVTRPSPSRFGIARA